MKQYLVVTREKCWLIDADNFEYKQDGRFARYVFKKDSGFASFEGKREVASFEGKFVKAVIEQ